jgi:hypothetical protein
VVEVRDVAPGLKLWRQPHPAWREGGAPFEHVLVSHGEPVPSRADFEAALEGDPW